MTSCIMHHAKRLMMEDDLLWKTTYDGRRLMMEDDLRWKTTDEGRVIMVEVSLQSVSLQRLYVSLT